MVLAERAELRRSYGQLIAARAAWASEIPREFFLALYDDPQEAEAMYQLHAARSHLDARGGANLAEWGG